MAKVMTFSREFPAYHPKAGEPTYFVEKFYNSFNAKYLGETFLADYEHDVRMKLNRHLPYDTVCDFLKSLSTQRPFFAAKHHTIREGKRWKVGDYFSPRVWGTDINPKSGKKGPYQSKQIIIAPDIQVKKVWDITLEIFEDRKQFAINTNRVDNYDDAKFLAMNDGLHMLELFPWFNKPFDGQIVCWNENINY